MILRSLTVVILISLCRLPLLGSTPNDPAWQINRSVLSPLNVSGIPTHIIQASIESMIVSSWVEFEVYNPLREPVQELRFRILKYSNTKLIGTADGVVRDPVPLGSHRYRILVEVALDPGTQGTLIITKVRTSTGVWFIEPDVLTKETRAIEGATIKLHNAVTYQPNLKLTAAEKTEILAVVLNQIARDPSQSKLVGENRRLLVSRDDCSYATQLSDSVPVQVLSLDEIQAIADKEQRATYIRCGPFDVEGSRVRVHLILNDRLARGGRPVAVPFKYNFEFVLLKSAAKWVVEKSDAYS